MFNAILNQMIVLFGFMAIGYLLGITKLVPENSASVLSKLENYLFVPCFVFSTLARDFTIGNFSEYWIYAVFSLPALALFLVMAVIFSKLVYKDDYLRKIAVYGFTFSNFAFMGYAVMEGVMPELMSKYVVFTLPFWCAIYAWGAPALLIADGGKKKTAWERIKPFVNPMFIAMILGAIWGLIGAKLPAPLMKIIDASSSCMSPVSMILSGMVIANARLLKIIVKPKLYIVTALKLVAFPLIYIFITAFIPRGNILTPELFICGLLFSTMPIGMNTIIVPEAYGKDTTDASGMVFLSHLFSVITIPLAFALYSALGAGI